MDYLKIFNPLETGRYHFLTGGWRGFKNEAGKMIGSHQMSTKARDAYDAARKAGHVFTARNIAEREHKAFQERKAAKLKADTAAKADDKLFGSAPPPSKKFKDVAAQWVKQSEGHYWSDFKAGGKWSDPNGVPLYLPKAQGGSKEWWNIAPWSDPGSGKVTPIFLSKETLAARDRYTNERKSAVEWG